LQRQQRLHDRFLFERDVQARLEAYLSGSLAETDFLKDSRPWKNYPTDYRPLVEFAKERHWPVLASNAPRTMASLVARSGLPALDTLPAEVRFNLATAIWCPEDDYFKKFSAVMGDMSSHGPTGSAEDGRARLLRTYQSQCLKDETMGESVARAWQPGRLVVHYNGAFHSDFRLGTAARALARTGGARMLVVTAVPVKDLDLIKPTKEDRKRADYLLYVLAPAKTDSTSR
jgi:uncharacterized iron-regulated protein